MESNLEQGLESTETFFYFEENNPSNDTIILKLYPITYHNIIKGIKFITSLRLQ